MSVTNPEAFLKDLDVTFLDRYKGEQDKSSTVVRFVEPDLGLSVSRDSHNASKDRITSPAGADLVETRMETIRSRVVTLGDFIDADAVCNLRSTALATDADWYSSRLARL